MTPVWDPSSRNASSVIPDLIRDLLVARQILASKEMLNPVQHDTRVEPVIPDLIRDLLVARHILASKGMLNPVQHDARVGPVIPDLIRDLIIARHILASKEMLKLVQHDPHGAFKISFTFVHHSFFFAQLIKLALKPFFTILQMSAIENLSFE